MYSIILLVNCNIKVYLRDKIVVFFLFLLVIILFGLYILFLGNNLRLDGLEGILIDN